MRRALRAIIKRTPILGDFVEHHLAARFAGSRAYWEQRYSSGGDSGVGSYGMFAQFKASVVNACVEKHDIASVIEFGCGDGNQLSLARYPQYLGFDVSSTAVERCRKKFEGDQTKSFQLTSAYSGERADLALSMDVIFHLVENAAFESHMHILFDAALRFVIIYSSDFEDPEGSDGAHVRHHKFTRWVERHRPDWILVEHIPNRFPYQGDYRTGSFSEFFVYEKA